jgi:hypothetical protein
MPEESIVTVNAVINTVFQFTHAGKSNPLCFKSFASTIENPEKMYYFNNITSLCGNTSAVVNIWRQIP